MTTKVRPFALAVALLSAAACGGVRHIPPESYVSGIDFRPHSADGFLFSPNPYTAAHDVIGLVTVGMKAELNLVPGRNGFQVWKETPIPVDTILARAKARVLELGGNALVNFTIRRTSDAYNEYLSVPGVEVTGLAIKRTP